MTFAIRFNEEKNQLLKATRGISFEDVLISIKEKKLLDNIIHPSNKHPRQRLYVVEIKGYAYAVPYILKQKKAGNISKNYLPW